MNPQILKLGEVWASEVCGQNHNKLDFQNSWELGFKVRTMKCFNCNEIAWQNCVHIYKFQLFLDVLILACLS